MERRPLIHWVTLIIFCVVSVGMVRVFTNVVTNQYEVDAEQSREISDAVVSSIINARGKVVSQTLADVVLKTSKGDITLELFFDKAPNTVENFVRLVQEGFYDTTKFHRVINGFMIQGGDPLSKGDNEGLWGTGGPGYAFADEINSTKLVAGVLAMANSGPNTNGSQFFIVTVDSTPWLDGKHTVFGKVIRGMDVVRDIEKSQTGAGDRPLEPIVINKAQFQH